MSWCTLYIHNREKGDILRTNQYIVPRSQWRYQTRVVEKIKDQFFKMKNKTTKNLLGAFPFKIIYLAIWLSNGFRIYHLYFSRNLNINQFPIQILNTKKQKNFQLLSLMTKKQICQNCCAEKVGGNSEPFGLIRQL